MRGSFEYKRSFWEMAKWPPIGGWLLIGVAAHSRFYCSIFCHDFFFMKIRTDCGRVQYVYNLC